MPTTPNALVAQLSPTLPSGVKTAGPAKSNPTDFRQALAVAAPVNLDAAKAAVAQTRVAQITVTPGEGTTLIQTAESAPEKSQNSSKNAVSVQPVGAKRGRKTPGEKAATAEAATTETATTTAQQATMPPGIAALMARAETIATAPAVPASKAAVPLASEQLAPSPAAPSPEAAADAALRKPDSVISTDAGKPAMPEAAPAAQAAAAVALPNIQIAASTTTAVHITAALQAPAKTGDITRQIAAALPAGSLTSSKSVPALHISLNPETLGSITVKVAQHASGETTVTLSASQPETLAALKHEAPNLNQILTNAGVPEANRQVNFQTMPVAAPQISTGLGNAGSQFAGGQFAGGQSAGGQQQQSGTAFATSIARPASAPAATAIAQPRANQGRPGVDVIA